MAEIYITLEVTKDTIIEGISCRKIIDSLSFPDYPFYFYQDDLKIYEYQDSVFKEIFDFGLEIGDTLNTYRITGIDTIEVNGRLFPRQSVQSIYDTILINGYETEHILYPIGFLHSVVPLRYIETSLTPTIKWYSVIFFADELGNTTYFWGDSNWLLGNNEVSNQSKVNWKMTTSCQFTCESTLNINKVYFYSIDGQFLFEVNKPENNFDIPCQYSGLIIGQMYLNNGEQIIKKFYLE